MDISTIKAPPRTAVGKSHVRQLRIDGFVPAVVYGEGKEAQSLQIQETELLGHLRHHHRVFQLDTGGATQAAYLQDIQYDAITDRALHVDFKRVDLTKPISVMVEVTFTGHPAGIAKGGRFIKDNPAVRVRCLPIAIPDTLEIGVAHLELDDKILAKELPIPPGVTLDMPPDTVVCHVVFQKVEVIETPTAAEGAVAAEGEVAAEGAAAGAAPAAGDAKKGAAGAAPAAGDAKKGAAGAAAPADAKKGAAPAGDAKKPAGGDKGGKK